MKWMLQILITILLFSTICSAQTIISTNKHKIDIGRIETFTALTADNLDTNKIREYALILFKTLELTEVSERFDYEWMEGSSYSYSPNGSLTYSFSVILGYRPSKDFLISLHDTKMDGKPFLKKTEYELAQSHESISAKIVHAIQTYCQKDK